MEVGIWLKAELMIPLQATYGGIVLYNDAKFNYYIVI
jgi:hypothetical protein